MLRFILVAIFLLLYFLLGIPVLGILWLIGKVNKRSADLAALRIREPSSTELKYLHALVYLA